ncbi:MAG: CopG family transcriptional regulator [Candidatus Dormibacteria bacterium]
MAIRKQTFSLRVNPQTISRLTTQADRAGEAKTNLAERYLDESVRMVDHRGIVFHDGPAGRYPALAGTRLTVWQVIETAKGEKGDVAATAAYLNVPAGLVRVALGYYSDYPEEIDRWIETNAKLAEEAEATWTEGQERLRR